MQTEVNACVVGVRLTLLASCQRPSCSFYRWFSQLHAFLNLVNLVCLSSPSSSYPPLSQPAVSTSSSSGTNMFPFPSTQPHIKPNGKESRRWEEKCVGSFCQRPRALRVVSLSLAMLNIPRCVKSNAILSIIHAVVLNTLSVDDGGTRLEHVSNCDRHTPLRDRISDMPPLFWYVLLSGPKHFASSMIPSPTCFSSILLVD